MAKTKVKIKFVDFADTVEFYQQYFVKTLEKFCEVEISDSPDYLFYSIYGTDHLKYNCVKIYFALEELEPDFNMCDYAIGYTNISFYDRYLYLPLFAYPSSIERTKSSFLKHTHPDEFYTKREKFCNFIYSNGLGDNFRENAFYALNGYKKVDSAGRFLNNMGDIDIAGSRANEDYEKTKIDFLQDYRFTIAMSNAQKFGYLDEKIFGAWIAGSIPIYWGDPKTVEIFNPKAFIDCTRCKAAEDVVAKVKEIDEDDEKYLSMQKEPIILDTTYIEKYFEEERIIAFFKNIFLQEYFFAKRVSNGIWSQNYHKNQVMLAKFEKSFIAKIKRKLLYILQKKKA